MFLETDKELIDSKMSDLLLSNSKDFDKITNAMRYSALGGKRLRGILTIEFAKMFGCNENCAIPYAEAIECVQAYSLIHDDLPCMDDDDIRRGKPSCHIAFGEAIALLAGDALLTHAFYAISASDEAKIHPDRALKATEILSYCAGYLGMVGGQVLDLEAAEDEVDANVLDKIHKLKTGALIKASVLMGCAAAGVNDELFSIAEKYAQEFGCAFQIIDDILDFSEDNCELNSYVKIHGLENSKVTVIAHINQMSMIVKTLKEKGFNTENIRYFEDYLIKRMNK